MDAYVRGGINSDSAYGSMDPNQLFIKGVNGDGDYAREAYVQFDLSAAGQVTAAQLVVQKSNAGGDLYLDVAVVSTDNWSENTLTWNSKPSSMSIVGHIDPRGVATLDVNAMQSYISDNGLLTLRLYDASYLDSVMVINSKESGMGPKLRVTSQPYASSSQATDGSGGAPIDTNGDVKEEDNAAGTMTTSVAIAAVATLALLV